MSFEDFFNLIADFFTKFIEDSFINLQANVTILTVSDVIISIFWSLLLSFIIAITYRGTHRGVSYSQNFTQTLVLLGLIVNTVMMIIGTDLARAFTLVGALSIVRFRTAIKDARDIGFIFFAMVTGMACGTRFYFLAIIISLVGCGLTYFMTFTEFGKKWFAQDILEIYFPTDQSYAEILSPIFIKYLKYYSLLGVDSVDDGTNRISFIVTFKRNKKGRARFKKDKDISEVIDTKADLLAEIQKIPYITNVKIIEGSSSVEI